MPDNSCDERLKTKAFQSVSFWSATCTNVVTWDCVDFLLCGSRWRCAKAAKSYGVPKFPDAAIIAVRDSVNTNKDIKSSRQSAGCVRFVACPGMSHTNFQEERMRFEKFLALVASLALLLCGVTLAQETTAGLQGTVKDASGAVVGHAHVVVSGSALAGDKSLDSESNGYYHFANLPPGVYNVVVTAKGFKTEKREGLKLEVGHLPTVDIALEVGTAGEVVEVTGQAPVIDVTTNTNQTNLTSEAMNDTPHGYSFQSVIQFSPMARNEPLMGGSAGMTGNSGGSLPGSAGNGNNVGFSVGGGADSENQYLVEGQDTENISGGASGANVPFQFIQEVQAKSSGIEPDHGGALGGVVNVVMKKGQNAYHGSFFATYEGDPLNGSTNAGLRYNPNGAPFGASAAGPGFDDDS